MKHMLIMRATQEAVDNYENMDFEAVINAMGAYNEALMKAGVMVGGDGLAPEPGYVVEFTAEGFVAGEDVAIALVLRHTSAAGNGTARALLDRAEHATVTGELILLGRISGTTTVRRID